MLDQSMDSVGKCCWRRRLGEENISEAVLSAAAVALHSNDQTTQVAVREVCLML